VESSDELWRLLKDLKSKRYIAALKAAKYGDKGAESEGVAYRYAIERLSEILDVK
jgi:hypothetical protein